jgi:hypothetical protein
LLLDVIVGATVVVNVDVSVADALTVGVDADAVNEAFPVALPVAVAVSTPLTEDADDELLDDESAYETAGTDAMATALATKRIFFVIMVILQSQGGRRIGTGSYFSDRRCRVGEPANF